MKEFIITEQQAQMILNVLAEFPAKKVIQAIDALRSLKQHVEQKEVKE